MLRLMYITNDPEVAKIAENAGVDRIFVDMEYIGKSARQGGMDTVQNHHTINDVNNIKRAVSEAEVMARINPWYECSKEEIEETIEAGADAIMLPYFKTASEVSSFIDAINGRVKAILLLETQEAVNELDDILAIDGIDEIHIGLNDLSISQGKKFMFELLTDGTAQSICNKIEPSGIPYGIGGIAALGEGALPCEHIIKEHYRLGSSGAILSRSFCNTAQITSYDAIRERFTQGVKAIRDYERTLEGIDRDSNELQNNLKEMTRIVSEIREAM